MTRSFMNPRGTDIRKRRALRPLAESLEGRLLLTAGDLDTSFGSAGYAITQAPVAKKGIPGDRANAVAKGRPRADRASAPGRAG